MKRRIDFRRENRPFFYYQRVPILHAQESVLFKVDSRFNYLLRAVYERHNGYAADCSPLCAFAPADVDAVNDTIAVSGTWTVNRSVVFQTTNTLPPPLVAGTVYFINAFAGGKIKLSASYGGGVLDLTGAGVGNHTVYAAPSPPLKIKIERVSNGEGEFYHPLDVELFSTPGPVGVGMQSETAPYNLDAYGINFTATPRKLAKPLDTLFISSESMQVLIEGQTINSGTIAVDNLPSYVDILFSGRHYPDSELPSWRGLA